MDIKAGLYNCSQKCKASLLSLRKVERNKNAPLIMADD